MGVLFFALGLSLGGPAFAQAGDGAPPKGLLAPEDNSSADESAAERPSREDVHQAVDGTFELHVQKGDIRSVLKQIGAQSNRNVIVSKGVSGEVNLDLYGVTFDEALTALARSNNLVVEKAGGFIYLFTPEEFKSLRTAERQRISRVFPLAYLQAEHAATLIANALSESGKATVTPKPEKDIEPDATATGGKDHASQEVIVVTDFEENLKEVERVLARLDVRPQQVLIEATILSALLNSNNSLGVDLEMISGVRNRI
jgi:type IV pilus assembly protein PilQ